VVVKARLLQSSHSVILRSPSGDEGSFRCLAWRARRNGNGPRGQNAGMLGRRACNSPEGGAECFGVYRLRKGLAGFLLNWGICVKRMCPCDTICKRT
jgi:hypothetical protein